jgi:hypothetical protein
MNVGERLSLQSSSKIDFNDNEEDRSKQTVLSDQKSTTMSLVKNPSMVIHDQSVNRLGVNLPEYYLDLKLQSLSNQMKSVEFISLSIYFVVCSFWANFYLGTIDMQLGDILLLDFLERDNFGRKCTIIMALGAIIIPFVGLIMDFGGFPITSFLATSFGISWSILLLLDDLKYILAAFVCYTLFRTFLFTFTFAYLADTLGFKYFGFLAGLVFLAG